jgi:Fe-S-cluster-containing hydrogenase component 2
VFGSFLNTFLKVTDPRPHYVGERCLVERHSVGGCDQCQQACPHSAIRIGGQVEVLEDACTGCGLCVQACPTGALEYGLVGVLGSLKDQGIGEAAGVACLKCSKVPDEARPGATTLNCLGRTTVAMLLTSSAWGQSPELLHGDCANCRLGSASVPRQLQETLRSAQSYRASLSEQPLAAHMLEYQPSQPGQSQATASGPAAKASGPAVSRRGALGALFGGAKQAAASAIPDRLAPGVDTRPEPSRIPDEWLWRRRAQKPKPAPEQLVHWQHPVVDENCIFCPVCENVCPTKALRRERHEDGSYTLTLETAACVGCDACTLSCPPSAITLAAQLPFGDLGQTILLREGSGF